MDELISRQAAINEVSRWLGYLDDDMILRIQIGLRKLPSVQHVATDTNVGDTISRQQAIDAIKERYYKYGRFAKIEELVWSIEKLPSAQPETPCYLGSPCEYQNPDAEIAQLSQEGTTKGTTADTISRQAAIDALHMHLMYRMGTDSNKKRLDEWINNLPTVQPEEAIPVSWIEAMIKKLMMTGDAFSGLTASIIRVMLNEWKKEQEGDTT